MSEDNEPEYCNVCENFPCLGNHPPGAVEEARGVNWNWLMQYNVKSRLEVERGIMGYDMVPVKWPDPPPYSPLLNLFRGPSVAEQRAAEEKDRREWIDGIRRRLGLVAEVHRTHVHREKVSGSWSWTCRRCAEGAICAYDSQAEAFAWALDHARAFVPDPPEETPVTELDLVAYGAAWACVRAQQDSFGAALPERMTSVAGEINERLAGLLPDGMRFEWVADGE